MRVAVFEETGEQRQVVAWCSRCGTKDDDWPEVIVSPAGVAHLQAWEGTERTECGADGTAPGWWWHL